MSDTVWRMGFDGKVRPDPPPTNEQLFAHCDPHAIEVRQPGGDWEWVGERRNKYLAMEYANTFMPGAHEVRIRACDDE